MAKKTERRVAFVTNVLAHYRLPCFEALAARMPGRIDFFLLTEGMAHRSYVLARRTVLVQGLGTLPMEVLPGRAFSSPPYDDTHLNDPRPALQDHDVLVLGGWAEPSYLLLWTLAQILRKGVVFWIESTEEDLQRVGWKESFKRTMLGRAAGVVVSGTSAERYCERLGVPSEKIFRAPNAIDVDYFSRQARTLLPQREQLRAELELQGVVILFAGRMIESFKNVSVLLAAQRELEGKDLNAELVLIGEGQDRARYEEMARGWDLRGVRFVNFLEHDTLCRYYAAADIFVLPSRSEPWGFVLNEAMEFGLPVVVSNVVGAAADLVEPNGNGLIVAPDDASALSGALEKLAQDDGLRARMGKRSREIISHFTPEAWADGFAHALESALADK